MNLARFSLCASLLVACGGSGSPASAPGNVADGDERGSIGVPNPAAAYCTGAGFTDVDEQCQFPDGTSCPEFDFYYAKCGQSHSYCEQHGGTVVSQDYDAGTFTAVEALCTV